MRQRIWIVALLVGLLAIVVGSAAAQSAAVDGPVTNIDGDLYVWNNGASRQLTDYGYNERPIGSPDGRYVAYLSAAEEALDQPFAGVRPSNIWLLDRMDGSFQRVVDSSDGLRFRSEPNWSPDSTQLVWSELSAATTGELGGLVSVEGGARLVVYDMTTATQRVLTTSFDLGYQDGGLYMPPVDWGAGAISRVRYTAPLGPDSDILLELWDPATGAFTSYTIGNTGNLQNIISVSVWGRHNDADVLIFGTRGGGWWTLNPANGERRDLTRPPSLRGRVGVVDVYLTPLFNDVKNSANYNWQVYYLRDGGVPPVQEMLPLQTYGLNGPDAPAIGPGGAAWTDRDGLNVWTVDGVSTTIADTNNDTPETRFIGGAAWLGTTWQTNEDGRIPVPMSNPPVNNTGDCGVSPFNRGAFVQVLDGAPNNLRTQPTSSSDVIDLLPAGITMQVTRDAVCNEGYFWFYVEGQIGSGWTAGGPNTTWIGPAVDIPNLACPLATRLRSGMDAVITPGPPNNLRAAPSLSAAVQSVLPAGTRMTVVEGPVCADGLNWYRVVGTEWRGWTAEGQNGIYWLQEVAGG